MAKDRGSTHRGRDRRPPSLDAQDVCSMAGRATRACPNRSPYATLRYLFAWEPESWQKENDWGMRGWLRSEEHTSELQSRFDLVCRLLLEKKKKNIGKDK